MKKKKKQETYLFYLIKTIIKKIMVSTEMNIIIVCNIYIYIYVIKKKNNLHENRIDPAPVVFTLKG